ncbi:RecQ family ATP-dependent DNA helicase [Flavobacterium anhuiense]|uniref:RecQ family ATP-dependent DNA helicase n=1 Tax=Flavobacterium anhuiense TaxID=459526 RepID=UPI003D96D5CC
MLVNKQNNNRLITFIDTEIESVKGKILDIGAIKEDGNHFHDASLGYFTEFLKGSEYICGHNILNHDIKYIGKTIHDAGINPSNIIDTLHLSPLLFPTKPYHSLVKDDKLQTEELNNPLNDSIKAQDLFNSEVATFWQTDETLKEILYLLLNRTKEFGAFFRFVNYQNRSSNVESKIRLKFQGEICEQSNLTKLISENPIELAYCISLIHSFILHKKVHSITPPWVLKNYPEVERIMLLLRSKPCLTGCNYCNNALNIHKGLKKFFGFDSYRTYGGEPLQEKAVKAAVKNKSVLAVFPTGGGKSITFQVPALMSAENSKALTIIISPLQSLMKDQVDNLEKNGITEAVTINGLLDPIERAKSIERIEDGSASILYISPESLRSKTIEKLILGRKTARFVIDEAHCFSSWGQDFRVDYLYIGDFIRLIQEKKNLEDSIPVSCFTATAKQKVIEDIRDYFREKLSLDLEIFTSKASRTNLNYKVFKKQNEDEKYLAVRDLIEEKNCPTIIYVSRTLRAYKLAEQLLKDGFNAKPYHGKMDKKEKTENQNLFLNGDTQIMVATSAFGMGVDKKDVGLVIHYEISDSLENYVQEAGRAGRDENISADCFVLFNEEDLSKHFILLNQTKLSIKEIQQIWKAIKDITRFRSKVSNSALEIARKAGWDDNVAEIETRVTTAIAALEDAGYLKRGQNMPRIFASSILSKNAQEAIDKINSSKKFEEKQKEQGVRIIKKLFSSKSRKENNNETPESRVDYISDHLGIVREEVINIVNLLREENILADAKDLTAFIKNTDNKNRSLAIVDSYSKIENFLLSVLKEEESIFHLKELNEFAEKKGYEGVSINKLKTIINFWSIKNWIKGKNLDHFKNHIAVLCLQSKKQLIDKLEIRHELAKFIVDFFYNKTITEQAKVQTEKDEILVEFSVHELKTAYDNSLNFFKKEITFYDIEDTLFYLSRIEAIKIEGGFLVVYNALTIERTEQDNKKRYTKDDYQKLNQFYESKIQQIHIVGEYAERMIDDYRNALQFVEDYFQLNYNSFLNKYFKGSDRQNEIRRNITPRKFQQLFGELSPSQLKIIKDNETQHIVVAAGPGSGKTKVLVHKLASLLLMEDVKHEQLLMLTFSRAAVIEFKKRLLQLIGNAANFIEIKTFHSYCFDLLGKVGSLEKSTDILNLTVERIKNGDVEANKITKTVLVIDEAQDMNADEFALINALMHQNEEMRVIAVGDDDQNIYEFRGASSKYLEQFIYENKAIKYELVENYRSKSNLVTFSNQFLKQIQHRLKETPIIANQTDNGKIKVINYKNCNLITPLVKNIENAELSGTTCIITKTNEEAVKVTGLLLMNGIKAKLIQSNDGFNLYNLVEVRFFLNKVDCGVDIYTISDEVWNNAKKELNNTFCNSNKLEICLNIIKDFETTNPTRKYKSDLEVLIRESKLEDFYSENGETIFVSTVHKAKGKEFDNVFLLLEKFNMDTDEAKRQLYVAMTRAKSNLNIHLNADYLNHLTAENLEQITDIEMYSAPDKIAIHATFKDIWLDYFINRQPLISQLKCGDRLHIDGNECLNSNGQSVLKFSKQFIEKIEIMKSKNYQLRSVNVNFILHWFKEETSQDIKIILPELYFEIIELK